VTELTAELLVDRLDPREVAVSPDGRLVAFVAAPVGRREEDPQSAVWLARSDAAASARPFTSGTAEDKAPRFAPDGLVLYFLSDREERKVAQLYRVRLDGGEAERLTEGKPGVAAYAPLADGTRVVLVSADAPSEEDERRECERDDANAFGDWKPQRLQLLDLETRETRKLTAPGERHVRSVAPAPGGSFAAVVLWETPEIDNIGRAGELAVVDLDADEIVADWPLVAADASVAWTGSRGLCVLGPVETGGQAGYGVFVVGLDGDELRLVTGELDADPIALATDATVFAVARAASTPTSHG
jgi:dipeptidyl aminopeptidase/acylaminoacyl peptidase